MYLFNQRDFEFEEDESEECELCEGGLIQEICGACSGSGEGSYDGSTCQFCQGSGEVIVSCTCKKGREMEGTGY